MPRQSCHLLFWVLMLICCVGGCTSNSKWEYKQDRGTSWFEMEKRLDKYGDEGWELVSLATDRPNDREVWYHTVFKRPKR